jgi:hypothetical protein
VLTTVDRSVRFCRCAALQASAGSQWRVALQLERHARQFQSKVTKSRMRLLIEVRQQDSLLSSLRCCGRRLDQITLHEAWQAWRITSCAQRAHRCHQPAPRLAAPVAVLCAHLLALCGWERCPSPDSLEWLPGTCVRLGSAAFRARSRMRAATSLHTGREHVASVCPHAQKRRARRRARAEASMYTLRQSTCSLHSVRVYP